MSNDQNQAATGMSIDTPEFRDLIDRMVKSGWRKDLVDKFAAQLARQGKGDAVYQVWNAGSGGWDDSNEREYNEAPEKDRRTVHLAAPAPASAQPADLRALDVIKELSRSSMSLAADLVKGATYTFQGHDYLDRNFVCERVVQWRQEWDATAPARDALVQQARASAQPDRGAAQELPVELMGIREEMGKGSGFWSSCSGCHDTEDGHPTGPYSYSRVFGCALGSGCSECGGIGAVWDNTDYEAMACDSEADDAAPLSQPVRGVPDEQVRQLLQEFVDYHSKPAGMTLETATDSERLGEFLKNIEAREKGMVDRAKALLAAAPSPAAQPVAPAQGAPDVLAELERLRALLNTPELYDFTKAVVLEAAHQRERWSTDHDAGKAPADWFWLIGYLGGKALNAHMTDNVEKALHHTISTAAACANWHAAILGKTTMRPGIGPPPDQPHSTATEGAATDSPLVCQQCGADRSKDPCGNPRDCGMIGQAYSAATEGADGMGGQNG